jgi:GMP synthase-like glutamine amidotransferase
MRVHFFQHVPFEDPAFLLDWCRRKQYTISYTRFYEQAWIAPDMASMDRLIIMGGPMGVYDDRVYPWLRSEKKLIEQAIRAGKRIIAICLGAQLAADVLGAKVFPNRYKEIGWFPVAMHAQSVAQGPFFHQYPETFTAFHWHGDTFDIPQEAQHVMRSDGCENQAFVYQDRVFAFQFHLESTPESVANLITNCRSDITQGPYVQSEKDMIHHTAHFPAMHRLLEMFLDIFAGPIVSHPTD